MKLCRRRSRATYPLVAAFWMTAILLSGCGGVQDLTDTSLPYGEQPVRQPWGAESLQRSDAHQSRRAGSTSVTNNDAPSEAPDVTLETERHLDEADRARVAAGLADRTPREQSEPVYRGPESSARESDLGTMPEDADMGTMPEESDSGTQPDPLEGSPAVDDPGPTPLGQSSSGSEPACLGQPTDTSSMSSGGSNMNEAPEQMPYTGDGTIESSTGMNGDGTGMSQIPPTMAGAGPMIGAQSGLMSCY